MSGASFTNLTALNAINASTMTSNNHVVTGTATVKNMNVSGHFSLTGLNQYDASFKAGDMISYIFKGTMTAALTNSFFGTLYGGFLPPTAYDINVYEVVYWGNDSRSNDLTRMSATLLIPSTLRNNTIVSSKHETLVSPFSKVTLWNLMSKWITSGGTSPDPSGGFSSSVVDYSAIEWAVATSGNIVVCADNPGYGISPGTYNYLDPAGETFSQYNALIAATQFIEKCAGFVPVPTTGTFSAPYNVINSGYSLGALVSGLVSQCIEADPLFNLVNTLPGAPVNVYDTITKYLFKEDGSEPSSNLVGDDQAFLLPISANSNRDLAGLYHFNPSYVANILPIYNQLYLNTLTNTHEDLPGGFLGVALTRMFNTPGFDILNADESPWMGVGHRYYRPSAFVTGSKTSYFDNYIQSTFYTNTFADYTNLAGKPMCVMYSLQDELCCYDKNDPYVGGGDATDLVKGPLATFFTTPGPYGNYMNAAAKYTTTDFTITSEGEFGAAIGTIAGNLIASETTGALSRYRFDASAIFGGPVSHSTFPVIWVNVVLAYLSNR